MIGITRYVPGVALFFQVVPFVNGQEAVTPPSSVHAESEPERKRSVSPQIAAMLAASMPKYEPAQRVVEKPVEVHSGANEQAVVMAPLVVNGDHESRLLLKKIREEKEKAAGEKFNWKDGGTILQKGRTTLELKFNPKNKGFDILNIKW